MRAAYAARMADFSERARAGAGGRRRRRRAARLLRAPSQAARRRARRGARELTEWRTGYETPIAVAVAASGGEVLAVLPVTPELRADPGAVGERSAALAAAAVEHVVEGASPGPPRSREDLRLRLGELDGMLLLAYPAADAGRGGGVRARGSQRRVRRAPHRPAPCARASTSRPRARGRHGPARRRSAPRTRCGWPRR